MLLNTSWNRWKEPWTRHFTKATSLSVSGWFVVVLNTLKCINIPQKRMGNWRTILRGLNRRITPPQKYMFYWKQKINVCWQTVGLSLLVKRIYVRFFMSNIAMDFLRDLQFFFFLNVLFDVWGPQVKCEIVLLCLREGWHRHSSYTATHTNTI